MELALTINTESGDDLIVSIGVRGEEDPTTLEWLNLIRTPKYEPILEDYERGVSVSFDRYYEDEKDFLAAIEYLKADNIVRIKTSSHAYELDVRKVDPPELKEMRQVLRKMNFDQRFQMLGI